MFCASLSLSEILILILLIGTRASVLDPIIVFGAVLTVTDSFFPGAAGGAYGAAAGFGEAGAGVDAAGVFVAAFGVSYAGVGAAAFGAGADPPLASVSSE